MERDIPLGAIVSWSGSIVSIPPTFRLCDGTEGTPDLRDRFVTGAGSTYAVGATGGAIQHGHAFTSSIHWHDFLAGTDINPGTNYSLQWQLKTASGNFDNADKRPPYYALCYIMYAGRVM